jgi:hydroxypyruvate reductase
LTRALRLSGADIRELNVVRRHLCGIKGGGLAEAARGPVWTLVTSDVLGGGLHDVGSGPSVPDPTRVSDARRVLRTRLPFHAIPRLHETMKPGDPRAARWRGRIVASPDDLARAVAARLGPSFPRVSVLRPSSASVEALAVEYATRAARLRPGEALVRAAEPSLRIERTRPGRGGRSTHLACCVAPDLPPGVTLLLAASDGVDGTSGTAGAVVDATLTRKVSREDLRRAIAGYDTGRLLERVGVALRGGPTGHNFADVHVLARAP